MPGLPVRVVDDDIEQGYPPEVIRPLPPEREVVLVRIEPNEQLERSRALGSGQQLPEFRAGATRAGLRTLLAEPEVEATAERLGRLLALGRFPEPDPGVRPFPWPPI